MLPKQRVAQQYEYTNKNNQAPWPFLLFFPRPTFISAVDDAKVFFSQLQPIVFNALELKKLKFV